MFIHSLLQWVQLRQGFRRGFLFKIISLTLKRQSCLNSLKKYQGNKEFTACHQNEQDTTWDTDLLKHTSSLKQQWGKKILKFDIYVKLMVAYSHVSLEIFPNYMKYLKTFCQFGYLNFYKCKIQTCIPEKTTWYFYLLYFEKLIGTFFYWVEKKIFWFLYFYLHYF